MLYKKCHEPVRDQLPNSDAERDQSHPRARETAVGETIQDCFREKREPALRMQWLLTGREESRGTPGRVEQASSHRNKKPLSILGDM